MKKYCFLLLLFCFFAGTASAAIKPGDAAPLFTLKDLAGRDYNLADTVGSAAKKSGKGVMLGFIASWCASCRQELPLISALQNELAGKGVGVVLIDVKDSPSTTKTFADELHLDGMTVLTDREGTVAEQYQVLFFPTTYLIGADGIVKKVHFGAFESEQGIRDVVDALMQK